MSWHEKYLSNNTNNKTISKKADLFDLFEEVYKFMAPNLVRDDNTKNCLLEDDYKILDEVCSVAFQETILEQKVTKKQRKEAQQFLLTLPSFVPTESWGDPTTAERKTINRIFAVMGGGRSVEKKLEFLQRITDPTSKIESPRRVIASLLILEALAALIYSFNEASAGFVFEGWLAALLQGRQEAERSEKGNLPIQDLIAFSELKDDSGIVPVSLKLLSPTTNVEGSFTNLIDAIFDDYADKGGAVNYVVARKNSSVKPDTGKSSVDSISIESFDINQRNFIDLFTLTAGKMIDRKTREKSAKQKKHGLSQFTFKSQFRDRILASFPELVNREDRGFTTGDNLKVLDSSDDIAILKAHLDEPSMLYSLLQHCAGYTGRIRNPLFQDQEPSEEEQDSSGDSDLNTSEEPGLEQAPVKGEVSERQKSEGHTGWKISTEQVEFLARRGVIKLQQLGTLPASRETIVDVAIMHMDKVRDKFQVLFKAFSELTSDMNKYVTFPRRADAMNAGQRAIGHTETIQAQMEENITADSSAPDGDSISYDEVSESKETLSEFSPPAFGEKTNHRTKNKTQNQGLTYALKYDFEKLKRSPKKEDKDVVVSNELVDVEVRYEDGDFRIQTGAGSSASMLHMSNASEKAVSWFKNKANDINKNESGLDFKSMEGPFDSANTEVSLMLGNNVKTLVFNPRSQFGERPSDFQK